MNRIDRGTRLCSTPSKMKVIPILSLGSLALFCASCGSFDDFSGPLSSNFDPLSSPGSTVESDGATVVSPSYKPGDWVETAMANAAFFGSIPKGNARASKVLPKGTPMKVVSTKDTYVKVELDSGEVGFVPEIMVVARGANTEPDAIPDYGPIPPPVDPALGDPVTPPSSVRNGTPPAPVPGTIPEPAPEVPGVPAPPEPVPADPTPPTPVPDDSDPASEPKPKPAPLPEPEPTVVPPTVPGITDE